MSEIDPSDTNQRDEGGSDTSRSGTNRRGRATDERIRVAARQVLAMRSTLVPREHVAWRVDYEVIP